MKRLLAYHVELDGTRYNCYVDVRYHIDPFYGEDADGNRAIAELFIDETLIMSCAYIAEGHLITIAPGDTLSELILSRVQEEMCK